MGGISDLFASRTPQPNCIPISDGSGTLNDWVSNGSGSITGYYEPLTNGDPVNPELVFAAGDVIMVLIPS